MLFDYIGWTEVASLITAAIEKTFAQGQFTADLAQEKVACSTSGFAAKLIENL
jgi:isocitrate dehydrogenase